MAPSPSRSLRLGFFVILITHMYITKLGHCCLVIEHEGKKIVTDPGMWVDENVMVTLTGIDLILITHEHADHVHVATLQKIIENNPHAVVVTNTGVGRLLNDAGISHEICEGVGVEHVYAGVTCMAHDAPHEEIYETMGQVQNTGYRIGNFVYPGDAFPFDDVLQKRGAYATPVSVLALPVAGPWCRIRDSIRFACAVAPRAAFPVHDAMLIDERIGSSHSAPARALPERGILWKQVQCGERVAYDDVRHE